MKHERLLYGLGMVFTYGSLIGIGYLTEPLVGVLLFFLAMGHNIEHHSG